MFIPKKPQEEVIICSGLLRTFLVEWGKGKKKKKSFMTRRRVRVRIWGLCLDCRSKEDQARDMENRMCPMFGSVP